MSTNILRIDSSLFGTSGVSPTLAAELIEQLQAPLESSELVHHDLASMDIPHFGAETLASISEGSATLADQFIAELQASDVIVIGAPMYNFSIPSVLKSWFDHVSRAKATFEYTANGPVGLLKNKKVYVITTRGGIHQGEASDAIVPTLRVMLSFLGLDDVEFIYTEGLNLSGGRREEGIAKAQQTISEHVERYHSEHLQQKKAQPILTEEEYR